MAAAFVTGSIRALPYTLRYPAIRLAARALAPLLGLSKSHLLLQSLWSTARRLPLNTRFESALAVVINAMTKARVPFQPRIVVEGEAALDAALRSKHGVLLVAPHAQLGVLILRYLYDRGIAHHGVAADDLNVTGTAVAAPILKNSPDFLFKARRILASQGVLVAMIDRSNAQERRVTEFRTPGGALRISSSLLELAHRFDVSIVFFMATIADDQEITLRLQAPSTHADVASVVEEFARFCLQGVGFELEPNCREGNAATGTADRRAHEHQSLMP